MRRDPNDPLFAPMPKGKAGPNDPEHCRRLSDHAPHGTCLGGPWAAPGNVGAAAVNEAAAVELIAGQWRENRRRLTSAQPLTETGETQFVEDSYTFARDALQQLKAAGVEMVVTDKGLDDVQQP